MTPNISILIITYNREKDTLDLLKNLKEQENLSDYVGEVLILNNNSTDSYNDLSKFVLNHPEMNIQYMESPENLGVARGRNYLFEKVKFPYLLVIDDDMEFPDQLAMKKLSTYFDKPEYIQNNVGIITFKVLYYENNEPQVNALPHKNYKKYGNRHSFLTYYFAGGANIMKKELLKTVGYLTDEFFYGMEEYDYSYRMIEAGYTLAYDDRVTVLHKESPHGRITNKQKMAMLWFNKSKVAWKYLPNKYYYSTAFMWSFQYLFKTSFDLIGFFRTWTKVILIPDKIKPKKIGKKALDYLKSVEARLGY